MTAAAASALAKKKKKPYPFNHLAAVRHLRRCDKKFEILIGRVGRFRMEMDTHPSPYEALMEAIVYQQLNGKAAGTIFGRVKDRVGGGNIPTPAQILAASDETLRGAGLSRQKLAAIRDLAQKTLDGVVPSLAEVELLADEEIVTRLTAVRGVGVWTVHMMLIFRLGRPGCSADAGLWCAAGVPVGLQKTQAAKAKRAASVWRKMEAVPKHRELVSLAGGASTSNE